MNPAQIENDFPGKVSGYTIRVLIFARRIPESPGSSLYKKRLVESVTVFCNLFFKSFEDPVFSAPPKDLRLMVLWLKKTIRLLKIIDRNPRGYKNFSADGLQSLLAESDEILILIQEK